MNNERFMHEGRHLWEWLLQLVEDEPERRRAAAVVVMDKYYGSLDCDEVEGWDQEQTTRDFQEAVRESLRQERFPAVEYVQKLFTLSMLLEEHRLAEWQKKKLQNDEIYEKFAEKMGPNPGRAELKRYIRRICVHLRRECQASQDEANDLLTGTTLSLVMDALGPELLPAAEPIRIMLKETHQSWTASEAICRMGATAIEFYPDLMEGLKLSDPNGHYAKPLGYLLRHYPEKVKGIYELTGNGDATIRENAIVTLTHCGRETIRQFPEIESSARERLQAASEGEWFSWAWLLGKTAVTPPTVTLLLEITRSKNAEHAGTALSCLGEMGRESERVVPRIIELIDEFEEYDPDWAYYGGYGRIIAALGKFGGAAKAAIPDLIPHVWGKPYEHYTSDFTLTKRSEPDEHVIKFLARFGNEAKAVLPTLREMKAELIRRGMTEIAEGDEAPENPEDCCPEYLQEAIAKIEGKP